jgi:hypothetical protein
MVATFTVHVLLVGWLVQRTQVRPPQLHYDSMTVEIADLTPMPEELPPPRPQAVGVATVARPLRPVSQRVATQVAPPETAVGTPIEKAPEPTDLHARIDYQRREVAADIARENAPARRPFAGRSLDAMLPDAENTKLKNFHPRVHDARRDFMRKLAGVVALTVPTAARDYHAPVDPLTERWEAAHHSSDMADCDREYARFDAEMRRQLCGFVRPPD